MTRSVPIKPNDSQAQEFGKKLATFSLRDIITRYIKSFIYEFLSRIMSRVDPNQVERVVQEAVGLSEKTSNGIATRIVNRVVKEGKLADTPRIHETVVEELRRLTEPKEKAVASK